MYYEFCGRNEELWNGECFFALLGVNFSFYGVGLVNFFGVRLLGRVFGKIKLIIFLFLGKMSVFVEGFIVGYFVGLRIV